MITAKKNAKKIIARDVGIYMYMGRYMPADTNTDRYVYSYKHTTALS